MLTQKINERAEELEVWVESIPVISGDITKYYDAIWDKISQQPDRLWPVLILAQLRQTVLPRDLFEMLPEPYKLSFQTFFPIIRYLFGQQEQIEIYHSSFKEYVDQKAEINIAQANDYIVAYCDRRPDELFTITNRLYHLTKSNSAALAISNCDQNWADKCALADVSPDLVLSDIQRIIDLSVDGLQTTALIRLLLLLERIKFRYDSVFAENASRIALALISLKKFGPSLNYIVRDKTLLVSDNDALLFLQLYYENGATNEGDALFESIDAKFRRQFREATETGKGIPMSIFSFKLDALAIATVKDEEWPKYEFMRLQQLLLSWKTGAEEEGMTEDSQAIEHIREGSTATLYACQLRQFDYYASAKAVSKFSNHTVDSAWTMFYGRALFQFNQFNLYNVPVKEKSERYLEMLKDVEDMMEANGYKESSANAAIMVESLMGDSKRPELLIKLIGDYLKNPPPSYSLKMPNGVDTDISGIGEMMFRYKCLGYIDEKNVFPSIDTRSARHEHWEDYILSMLQRISFLEGKLYRLKAEDADYSETAQMVSDLTTAINFSLDERRYWKSGYGVPEVVLPIIYQKIVEVQQVFDASAVDKTIAKIQGRAGDQWGLYTEGYRECLYVVVKQMILGEVHKNKILPIVEIWKNHILIGVQNRWERTPELLKIIEIYGLLQEYGLASALFKEMLQTSMGPGWYKEGQFDLLNTLLSVKKVPANVNSYFARFASILDFASGEMTFQQYIRNDKGRFIGHIIEQGALDKGIDYFKFEIVPPASVTIFNAENFTTDMPLLGDGYNWGANNINQEYSVLQVLNAKMHPLLRWALARIFIVNDDIDRYLPEYSTNLSTAINQIAENSGVQPEALLEDAANIAVSEEMKEDSTRFVNRFGSKLTGASETGFQGYLLARGIEWQIEIEQGDDDKVESHTGQHKESNRFDLFNDACTEGRVGVAELLRSGCQAFLDEHISIWWNNYSHSSKLAQDNIKALLQSDKDILPYIKEHIRQAESSGWSIVNHLLWYFEHILTEQQAAEVYEIVAEHFSLIVRPHQKYLDKYQWLNVTQPTALNDEVMSKFLIWLLNHPVTFVREQAYSCIQIILTQEPVLLVRLLIEEAVSDAPLASTEQAAILLSELANTNATVITEVIDNDAALYDSILAVKHFCIRKRFLDVSIKLNGSAPHRLYGALREHIPKAIILVGEVALDEPHLHSIDYEIDSLNELGILNRQFCETLLSSIVQFVSPLTVKEFIKSDKYLQRSFQHNSGIRARFPELVKHALNIAITPRVDENNLDNVFEIIND